MFQVRSREWLRYIVTVCVILFLKLETLEGGITIIESAVAKGAVCLDGSPPAYQIDKGFGDGVNNWLVHIQGGGWCHSIEDCVYRKTMDNGLGSSKLMPELYFGGILSNQQDQNPSFYNWNRVIMRYCDGASFTGDVEEVDTANNLYFRGARIFNVIVEELMSIGMKNAQNALLSGCSAGGLAAILNCDKFRRFFPSDTRVKCVPDAGFFARVTDLSGEHHFEKYYENVVTLHGSAKNLPSGCTSKMKPGLCLYPQYAMPHISTPIFILNSAYDTWEVSNILAIGDADPNGEFTKCKTNLTQCSTDQIKRLEEFRSEFLGAVSEAGKPSSRGMFINTCYIHCQSETQSMWLGSTKLDDKTIAEGVGEWFYDKSEFMKVDTQNVLPHYC
ncbi:pectin acetylesterase 8-like [Rutidosis leptorrhynchoides]|uniref:pectin acetylesterase 8-like n=1 Tax=Rutidosis leptorrhynchoides TaxID=125765 RepID=UPI003A99B1F4